MAYPGGLQLGGGVTCDNAADFLNAGASHVIVTSFVFREGRLEEERLRQMVQNCCSCLNATHHQLHSTSVLQDWRLCFALLPLSQAVRMWPGNKI
jgi:phosphoribosylformimino-5-aminoimidazole carboxamide ribonucleotide (ProFAR) isomerase